MAKSSGLDEGELIVLGLVALGVWIFSRGGLANAAAAIGEGAVGAIGDVASGVTTGVVTGVSKQVGLPTPAQVTDDPAVSRWIIDSPKGGKYEASRWSTSSAFINALTMDEGTGFAPPRDSILWSLFGGGDVGGIDFGYGTDWGSQGGATGSW